tara:strand:+ start:51244 stop:51495 length:252 start_codon:yes stop_codon:yes gene_type:complete
MLTIHYFASVREQLNCSGEELALPDGVASVAQLVGTLAARGGPWSMLQDSQQVLVAVNQQVTDSTHVLRGDEEVAFFPPMTGG